MEATNRICPYCRRNIADNMQLCSDCAEIFAEKRAEYSEELIAKALLALHDKEAADARRRDAKNKELARHIVIALLIAWVPLMLLGALLSKVLPHIIVKKAPLEAAAWQTDIEIEKCQIVRESGWTLPENARLIRTETENNSASEHYGQTKYYYKYETWVPSRIVSQTGKGSTPPTYGEPTLAENEREGSRSVEYFVTFEHKDKRRKIPCTEAEYYEFVKTGVVRFHFVPEHTPSPYLFEIEE